MSMTSEVYRAGPSSPGARLLAAAGLVAPGRVTADIGCDHGKLAVWLACKGISPRVIAVDIRPVPLARARALALQTGCADRVDCRLGCGLAPLAPLEAKEIIIAGLSGETMIEILEDVRWIRNSGVHLILLPVTRAPVLRRWLCENGFAIRAEKPVEDRGRFYTVLSTGYTGEDLPRTELFYEVGLLGESEDPAASGVLQNRLADLRKRAMADLNETERRALAKLTEEIEACLLSRKLQR